MFFFNAASDEKRHQIDVLRQGVLLHFSWRGSPTQPSRGSGFDYPPSQAATPSGARTTPQLFGCGVAAASTLLMQSQPLGQRLEHV